MEQRFQTGFGDVRIHDEGSSHGAARVLGAEAFTSRQHIHFGAGRWRPDTPAGLHLLAHELAHTVQERPLPAPGALRDGIELGAPDSSLEREADDVADRVAGGGIAQPLRSAARSAIRRKGSPGIEKIEDLLSYGLLDWAIRDAEAIEALRRLQALSRIEQAEFMADSTFADRLRENLPADRVAEFDTIAVGVKSMQPAGSTVDAIIDKLSYGLFDWAITDRDALEALGLLKTLSGEPLAIALKRIDHARLMDNLPEDRRPELTALMASALGPGGTFETAQVRDPAMALRSMDFLSDHHMMRNNNEDWSRDGKPFERPLWNISDKGAVRSGAISHTKGRQLEIELGYDVLPANAPPVNAVLAGKGSSPFLDFNFAGMRSGGAGQLQQMTSPNALPDAVHAHRRQSISWTVKWGSWEHPLGLTGPFDIYTTVGTPKRPANVTTKRMRKAVEIVGKLKKTIPHDVVVGIMKNWNSYNLDVKYANEWELADDVTTGAQCIDIVKFVDSVIGTVGLAGTAQAMLVWAQPTLPYDAIETPVGEEGGMFSTLVKPHPTQLRWQAGLFDGHFRLNNYEAALKFTADGQVKYYGGGVKEPMNTKDEVLRIFKCLAWFHRLGEARYEFTEIPAQYMGGCEVGDSHNM